MFLKLKRYNLIPFILLIFLNSQGKVKLTSISVGTAIVPNECSSLGTNNPLRKLDCTIFELSEGMCCMLTITTTDEELDDDGVSSLVEHYKTACIILPKINAKIINQTTLEYKYLGDVLIECSQNYFKFSFTFLVLITLLCI